MNLTSNAAAQILTQYFEMYNEIPGHIERQRHVRHLYCKSVWKRNNEFHVEAEDSRTIIDPKQFVFSITEDELLALNRYGFV
jgi:hypothetical protein